VITERRRGCRGEVDRGAERRRGSPRRSSAPWGLGSTVRVDPLLGEPLRRSAGVSREAGVEGTSSAQGRLKHCRDSPVARRLEPSVRWIGSRERRAGPLPWGVQTSRGRRRCFGPNRIRVPFTRRGEDGLDHRGSPELSVTPVTARRGRSRWTQTASEGLVPSNASVLSGTRVATKHARYA